MRSILIPALLLGLLAGCSGVNIGPHRIDVQQGNALDQENVARLKPGLNRSQVRFLLGTPLVVDPFRNDRWDYVYVYYKAGKLAEQKRISLFFEGDTLTRIEGDLPEATPGGARSAAPAVAVAEPSAATVAAPVASPKPAQSPVVPAAVPVAVAAPPTPPATVPAEPKAVPAKATATSAPANVPAAPQKPVTPTAQAPAVPTAPASPAAAPTSSVVQPLSSPKNASPYVDPRPPAELSLQAEIDVAQIKPDVIPPFPEPKAGAAGGDEPVLKSVDAWADAWARRDEEAYLAAYDASFLPQGGGGRADWEKRRRLLLGVAHNIELKVDSPSVDRAEDGTVTVTFNQIYRSDNYRDAVVKQLRMIERDGRWLIVEEKVLSILRSAKP